MKRRISSLVLFAVVIITTAGCLKGLPVARSEPLNIVDFPPRSRSRDFRAEDFFTDLRLRTLAEAVQSGDLLKIDNTLDAGIPIDGAGRDGVNALTWALLIENKAAFGHLLNKGASPNHRVMRDIPLVTICAGNEVDSDWLEMLLKANADPNLEMNNDRVVPVVFALFQTYGDGQNRNIELLIKHGANLNHRDRIGCTPLMWAVFKGSYEIASTMVQNGADATLQNDRGQDAVYHVISRDVEVGSPSWQARAQLVHMLRDRKVSFASAEAKLKAESPAFFRKWKASDVAP